MNILNFASYAKIIKMGMTKATNKSVTKLLIGLIVDNELVMNKNNEPYNIDDSTVSKWLNNVENITSFIVSSADLPEIRANALDYFEENVIPSINTKKEEDTYSALLELIKNDNTISSQKKKVLVGLYEDNELSEFLCETFLYALSKNNKISKPKEKPSMKVNTSDFEELIDDLTKDDSLIKENLDEVKRIIVAKRSSLAKYLNKNLSSLSSRKKELVDVEILEIDDIKNKIITIINEINETENEITQASKRIKELAGEISNINELNKDLIIEREEIESIISTELIPRINFLRESLDDYKLSIEVHNEISLIDNYANMMTKNLLNLENESKVKNNQNNDLGASLRSDIKTKLDEILNSSSFESYIFLVLLHLL